MLPYVFSTPQDCEAYVRQQNEWGIWDCEYVGGIVNGWMIATP